MSLRRRTASMPAAKQNCAASIFAALRPTVMCPTAATVQLTNPDGTCVPRDPNNPQLNQCIQVPIPVYGIASIGGDTNFTTNAEYRIPIAGSVTFSLFDDFGMDVVTNRGQLKQSPEGFASLTAPLYGCPVYNNGSCQGGIPGSQVGFQKDIRPVAGHKLGSPYVTGRGDSA